jgi:predicted protein tyrosine phosphatase
MYKLFSATLALVSLLSIECFSMSKKLYPGEAGYVAPTATTATGAKTAAAGNKPASTAATAKPSTAAKKEVKEVKEEDTKAADKKNFEKWCKKNSVICKEVPDNWEKIQKKIDSWCTMNPDSCQNGPGDKLYPKPGEYEKVQGKTVFGDAVAQQGAVIQPVTAVAQPLYQPAQVAQPIYQPAQVAQPMYQPTYQQAPQAPMYGYAQPVYAPQPAYAGYGMQPAIQQGGGTPPALEAEWARKYSGWCTMNPSLCITTPAGYKIPNRTEYEKIQGPGTFGR